MSDVDIPEPVPEKKASRKPRPSEIAKKAAKEQAEFKASIEPKPAALPKAAKAKTAPKPKSKIKAKAKRNIKKESIRRSPAAKPSGLILSRSYQRGGKVGAGLERPSGSMQATIVFEARQFKKLQAVARKNGVSFSEQVRQCVSTALAA